MSFQKASGTNHSRYTPVVSMMPRARNRDEPARKMNNNSATASKMLICDSHLMPTSRPEATEVTAILVTIAMRITWLSLFSSTPNNVFSPLFICMVPRPTVTATPNRVPRTAKMSMARPMPP